MKTLFVTGAEGFAGTHLIQHLRQRGYQIVAGVRNRGRKLAFERRSGKALVCDVADAINVARAIASVKPDGVIHLAGCSRAYEAADEPLNAYQTIVTSWANVLDAVRRAVPRAKVLMISAGDVYGTACGDSPVSENVKPQPVTTFGALKATAESIAETFYRNYHLDVTIARPFAYTGPGQSELFFYGSVARRLAEWNSSEHGSELQLPDLDCKRDLLHVDDLVDAYERLLDKGKPNEVYNVCSGQARPVRELVQTMVQASGRPVSLGDLSTGNAPQQPVLWGDSSKLREQLGWEPTRTAEQALRDLVRSQQTRDTALAG